MPESLPILPGVQVHTVQDAAGYYNSWPFVRRLGERRLVCAYSRGREHSITEASRGVYARVSDDGGASWGPEAMVANSADYCESAIGIGTDDAGALLLWVRCISPGSRHWRHDLYRSADGISYQSLASLPGLDPMPMQITDVMRVPEAGLMCFWFAGDYRDSTNHHWGTLVSSDGGRTWEQRIVETGIPLGEWPTEQCGFWAGDGRIFAIARAEDYRNPLHNRQFQLQSEDSGRTWRKARTNIGDLLQSTPSLIYDPETGLVHNYYYHRGAGRLKRRVAPLAQLWDHPMAWPLPQELATGSLWAADAGNANAAPGPEGSHCCAFYSGDERQTGILMATIPAL